MVSRKTLIFWFFSVIFAGLLPYLISLYNLHISIYVLQNIIIAVSWNIVAMTGQMSFGTAGFFGIGAYTATFMWELFKFPTILNIFLGGFLAAVASLIFGLICLRMRGIYFAVTTLGLTEALRVTLIMVHAISFRPLGTSVPVMFGGLKQYAYYFILIIGLASIITEFKIMKSKMFYAFTSIRTDEDGATMIGVNPTRYKIIAFVISSFFIGIAGGFYPFYRGYIEPAAVFDVSISIVGIIMPLFGGLYTALGPIIGAIVLTILSEKLRFFLTANQLIYGLILVIAILFMPKGIVGSINSLREKYPFLFPKAM